MGIDTSFSCQWKRVICPLRPRRGLGKLWLIVVEAIVGRPNGNRLGWVAESAAWLCKTGCGLLRPAHGWRFHTRCKPGSSPDLEYHPVEQHHFLRKICCITIRISSSVNNIYLKYDDFYFQKAGLITESISLTKIEKKKRKKKKESCII